jgi:hypothetical protein
MGGGVLLCLNMGLQSLRLGWELSESGQASRFVAEIA